MKNFNTNTDNNPEWLTPKFITDFFDFDLDPCSPKIRPWDTAKNHYFEKGLEQEWSGLVFCNPPYGPKEPFKWLKKCHEHKNCIALMFARTETKGFFSEIWEKADSVFFFKGRLKFHYVDGKRGSSANAPSLLIAYGENADKNLLLFSKKYEGKYIKL
jgi:hypothetical protein